MSSSTISVDDEMIDYMREVSVREPPLLEELRNETSHMEAAEMQISPEQGQFMTLLVEIVGAERALEIGTFTGYSAICIARALPDDGELVACDVSEEWTQIAQRYWTRAGLDDVIGLELRPALETVEGLRESGEEGTFDFAFIDADKENYESYYEHALALLRPGGVVAIDNTLWGGSVTDPDDDRASTEAIRAVNELMGRDDRVTQSLVPIGDGLTVARKRES